MNLNDMSPPQQRTVRAAIVELMSPAYEEMVALDGDIRTGRLSDLGVDPESGEKVKSFEEYSTQYTSIWFINDPDCYHDLTAWSFSYSQMISGQRVWRKRMRFGDTHYELHLKFTARKDGSSLLEIFPASFPHPIDAILTRQSAINAAKKETPARPESFGAFS